MSIGKIFLVVIFILPFFCSGQTDTLTGTDSTGGVFAVIEEMPNFPGGEEKLFRFIEDNVIYPAEAKKLHISGRVYVTFIITKEGKIQDAKIMKSLGHGCDEEAIRVVNSMPDWSPGKQNGQPVNVQFNLPVKFGK